MADEVGAIEYNIRGNITQIKKSLADTEKAAKDTGKNIDETSEQTANEINKDTKGVGEKSTSVAAKVGNAFAKMAAATIKAFGAAISAISTAIIKAGQMGVKYNAEMEGYEASFATLLGDEEQAIDKVTELKKVAASTPLAMEDLADATKTMLGYGLASDKTSEYLQILGDVSQGDATKLKSLTLAFSQISSKGKLAGQELNQMINAGFNPLNTIAKKTGLTVGELQDIMGSVSESRLTEILSHANEYGKTVLANGKISAEVVYESMKAETEAGGMFYGAMEKQAATFNGQISTLKDNAMSFLGELTNGLFEASKNTALPTINGWLNDLRDAFTEGGLDGMVGAFGDILGELLAKVIEFAPRVVTMAGDIVKKLVHALKDNSRLIINAVFEIAKTVLEGAIEIFPDVLAFAGDVILTIIRGLAAALPSLLPRIVEIAVAMVDQLVSMLPLLLDAGISLVLALAEGLLQAAPILLSYLPVLIEKLLDFILGDGLSSILDTIMSLFDLIVESLPTLITVLIEALPRIISALTTGLLKGDNLSKMISAFIKLFLTFATAIPRITWEILQHLPEILQALWDGITSFDLAGAGWDLLTGLWNGIKDAFDWVWSKVKGLFTGMVDGIKKFFGIASPSKLFRDLIGKNLDLGLAIGIKENADIPEDAALEMSKQVIHTMLAPDVSALNLGASAFYGFTNKNVVSVNNSVRGELVVDGYKLGEVVFRSFDDNYAYAGRG